MRSRLLGPVLFGLVLTALLVVLAGGPESSSSTQPLGDRTPDLQELVQSEPRHRAEAAELLAKWSPTFVQHVAEDDGGRDRPTRVDFDGDWDTTNNWDNQAQFGTDLPPAAYGAAVLTETHAYLTYTLYYPRDWKGGLCLPYICHDNDLENVLVVAERDGDLVMVETKAHLRYRTVKADEAALDARGRPLVSVEAEGHGPRPCRAGDAACEPAPNKLVYARGEAPSPPPARADGSRVHYELISLRDSLWERRHLAQGTLDLWTPGETGPLWYRGERLGRMGKPMGAAMASKRYPGGVRPPWGLKGLGGERGDWFLDPAAVAAERHPDLLHAGPGALEYVFHPYVSDLDRECAGARCAHPAPPPEPSRAGAWTGLGAMGMLLALWLGRSKRRLSLAARARLFARHRRER